MRIIDHKEPKIKFQSFLQNPLVLNAEPQNLSRKAKKYAKKRAKGFIPDENGGTYNFNKKMNWHTTNPEFFIAEARELLKKNNLNALNGIVMSLSNAFMQLEVQSREGLIDPERETKLRKALLNDLILFLEALYKKEKRTINEMNCCEKTVKTIELTLERLNELKNIDSEN